MKKRITARLLILFLIGGSIYTLIEIIWRALREGHGTHWSMFIVGGVLFLLLGGINEHVTYNMPLEAQCLLGALIITAVEFAAGCVLNIWLGLNVWDYSMLPGNLMGQVCPQFSTAWLILSGFAIVLDDWLRFWLFGEEKPRYRSLFMKRR